DLLQARGNRPSPVFAAKCVHRARRIDEPEDRADEMDLRRGQSELGEAIDSLADLLVGLARLHAGDLPQDLGECRIRDRGGLAAPTAEVERDLDLARDAHELGDETGLSA